MKTMDMDMPLMLLLSPIEWDESPLMSIVRCDSVADWFNVSLSFLRFALSPSPANVSSLLPDVRDNDGLVNQFLARVNW